MYCTMGPFQRCRTMDIAYFLAFLSSISTVMSTPVTRESLPEGYHRFELNKMTWEVPVRYQDLSVVGVDANGYVCAALDTQTNMNVAIMKLSQPFQSAIRAKQIFRELRLLQHIDHENIISLLDVFGVGSTLETFRDVYMVTHLMGADLTDIIKLQQLTDEHIQFFLYQILRGLKYIHSMGVIHRDLKPSNLAVNEDLELRIILDFGLARQADDEMTGYVATRWYRAPEIMLNWMHYTNAVDMWSVGCIMAELFTGHTLFPGTDHIDQLTRILQVTGTPDDEFLSKITSDTARNYLAAMPRMMKKDFTQLFVGASPQAVDLLEKMLQLDSDKRITAEQALRHPYVARYHDEDDEPVGDLFDDSFEARDLSADQWKALIFELIQAARQ